MWNDFPITVFIPSCPGLPLFWTSATQKGFQLADVVRLLSQETARLCSLDQQKGSIQPGYDADLVIWDPEREFKVTACVTTVYKKSMCVATYGARSSILKRANNSHHAKGCLGFKKTTKESKGHGESFHKLQIKPKWETSPCYKEHFTNYNWCK